MYFVCHYLASYNFMIAVKLTDVNSVYICLVCKVNVSVVCTQYGLWMCLLAQYKIQCVTDRDNIVGRKPDSIHKILFDEPNKTNTS